MLRTLLKRYGVVRTTLMVTLAAVILSELVTVIVTQLADGRFSMTGMLIALIVPVIIVPVVNGLQLNLLDKLEKTREELNRMATMDGLTQIYNRHHFMVLARQAFGDFKYSLTPFSIALFDIDDFKKVNDTYGHLVGDQALRQVADMAGSGIRKHDVLARYGGEEFIVLLPDTTAEQAFEVVQRLQQSIADYPVYSLDEPVNVTVSIGVATAQPFMQELDDLLVAADDALYRAKNSGKNRIEQQG